jgi:HlyD family secretion protein
MSKRTISLAALAGAALVAVSFSLLNRRTSEIVLTGIVTTDTVLVASEIPGRLQQVCVREGVRVAAGDLLALIRPQEWKADVDFYSSAVNQSRAQVSQAQAALSYQKAQTDSQILQAQANLAAAEAQLAEAKASLENAKLSFQREERLFQRGVASKEAYDQARTAYDVAKANVDSFDEEAQAAHAAVDLARSNTDQVAARQAALEANLHQVGAARAQVDKAQQYLQYTEIRSPLNGIVDTRVALEGEFVNPGQTIVTLIDPDNLWVRADVEESYIDRIRIGDRLQVTLPSGGQRECTVFYRGVDADYATQRDVSRTKRDIKTFELRLRCDNHDRALAVGMTAHVTLPLEVP